jgi:ubiquitin fusion degradation protein 1
VTVGDQLCIHYNDQNYYMDVREVQPPHPSSAACIIETDCYVDFEPPPGYKEPSVSDAATSQGTAAKQAYGGAPPPTTGKKAVFLLS